MRLFLNQQIHHIWLSAKFHLFSFSFLLRCVRILLIVLCHTSVIPSSSEFISNGLKTVITNCTFTSMLFGFD